jgi:UDP-3-O-[3-hydroxymyristoyl] N-acetylglucosamine deacetylase
VQLQRTLKYPFHLEGVGLHTGSPASVTVWPGEVDSGIAFFRRDVEHRKPIAAVPKNVTSTRLSTAIGRDGVSVLTIEHLMSSLYGLGIDNAVVEVNGPELPIMDGSAAPFVEAVVAAGIRRQEKTKRYLIVRRRVRAREGEAWAEFIPSRSFKVTCAIDFMHPIINDQEIAIEFNDAVYVKEISRARTFGFLKDVEDLRSKGFALGGSLANAVVIDDFNILNEEGLRYPDEFVRHKLLDALGDLALLGAPVVGHFRSYRSGHTLNQRLVRTMLERRHVFDVVSAHETARMREMLVEPPAWSEAGALTFT